MSKVVNGRQRFSMMCCSDKKRMAEMSKPSSNGRQTFSTICRHIFFLSRYIDFSPMHFFHIHPLLKNITCIQHNKYHGLLTTLKNHNVPLFLLMFDYRHIMLENVYIQRTFSFFRAVAYDIYHPHSKNTIIMPIYF